VILHLQLTSGANNADSTKYLIPARPQATGRESGVRFNPLQSMMTITTGSVALAQEKGIQLPTCLPKLDKEREHDELAIFH
jgi:hypothetical protein